MTDDECNVHLIIKRTLNEHQFYVLTSNFEDSQIVTKKKV